MPLKKVLCFRGLCALLQIRSLFVLSNYQLVILYDIMAMHNSHKRVVPVCMFAYLSIVAAASQTLACVYLDNIILLITRESDKQHLRIFLLCTAYIQEGQNNSYSLS